VNKASKISSTVLVVLLLAYLTFTVYATVNVNVNIRDPLNPANGAKGTTSNGYWVGEIPVMVTGTDSSTSPQQTIAYCMNFDKTIYVGSTYGASLGAVTDNPEWRAVSYILTWYQPPADANGAAANQVAIWHLLNITRGYSYYKPSWLTPALNNAGNALADEVIGKNVVRQGDQLQWIEPAISNQSGVVADPGATITFKALLTDSEGTPKEGVRILFSATLAPDNVELNSTYVSAFMTHTDSDGVAQVDVKVPGDVQAGQRVEVQASTRSVWPQMYLDLTDNLRQDLIGIGTCFELTVSTNLCVIGFINVIPEVPLGTLTAAVACGLAFVCWKKGDRLKLKK
jgi:hypothetical protein